MIHVFLAKKGSSDCAIASRKVLEDPDRPDQSWVIWIDLDHPKPDEEELVIDWLDILHPLTLEDIRMPKRHENGMPHLPKLEDFEDYTFLVLNPLREASLDSTGSATCTQLSCIVTDNVLVTWHYNPVVGIDALKQRIVRQGPLVGKGVDTLLQKVLDESVEGFIPIIDQVEENLDNLEEIIFSKPEPRTLEKLMGYKRGIQGLRRTLQHERDAVSRLMRGESSRIGRGDQVQFRDVHDHLLGFLEVLETNREMVSDLVQIYLACDSQRLNEVMRVLTGLSTLVLPMGLITGIYGMNVKMPETEWEYGYPMVLLILVSIAVGGFSYLKWRKWL